MKTYVVKFLALFSIISLLAVSAHAGKEGHNPKAKTRQTEKKAKHDFELKSVSIEATVNFVCPVLAHVFYLIFDLVFTVKINTSLQIPFPGFLDGYLANLFTKIIQTQAP